MDKGNEWAGYFADYMSEARRKGINPLEILDAQWADGRTTAVSVLPYVSASSDVLEIACGIGRVSRFVAPHCRHLRCADILDEALVEARNQLNQYVNVSFDKLNGYDLAGYESASFDCIYSFAAFVHFDFELVVTYFSEIKRVLKPGGTAVLEFKQWKDERDVTNLLRKIAQQGGIRIYQRELDKWRYVSKEMLAVLCKYFELDVLNEDVTEFTFRKP